MKQKMQSLFPLTAQYALRVMAFVASQPQGSQLRAVDVAGPAQTPTSYASKVLGRLADAGLLISGRGYHGGFRLSRNPSDIRLIEILSAVGVVFDGSHCLFGWDRCSSVEPCPMHATYAELKDALLHWATRHTLADIDAAPPPQSSPGQASRAATGSKRGRKKKRTTAR